MSFARGGTIRKSDAAVNLVVDTSVWSLVLRRPRLEEDHLSFEPFGGTLNPEMGCF